MNMIVELVLQIHRRQNGTNSIMTLHISSIVLTGAPSRKETKNFGAS